MSTWTASSGSKSAAILRNYNQPPIPQQPFGLPHGTVFFEFTSLRLGDGAAATFRLLSDRLPLGLLTSHFPSGVTFLSWASISFGADIDAFGQGGGTIPGMAFNGEIEKGGHCLSCPSGTWAISARFLGEGVLHTVFFASSSNFLFFFVLSNSLLTLLLFNPSILLDSIATLIPSKHHVPATAQQWQPLLQRVSSGGEEPAMLCSPRQ
jgi:hypothetical protein